MLSSGVFDKMGSSPPPGSLMADVESAKTLKTPADLGGACPMSFCKWFGEELVCHHPLCGLAK